MKARCAHCNGKLVRGIYLDLASFNAMKRGEEVEVCEVVTCIDCNVIAILWPGESEPDFYEETLGVHNERPETTEKKGK